MELNWGHGENAPRLDHAMWVERNALKPTKTNSFPAPLDEGSGSLGRRLGIGWRGLRFLVFALG